ncbi:MAG: aldehyde dehydrogenase family protein, partial [Acidimicrobiia bacterium]|nr:aldehyde dehydrogenase family protein [Acidimicrobiia bacterium]
MLRPATDDATYPTSSPSTGEVLGPAADGGASDMDAAVAAARRAYDETDWVDDHAFRARCLRQLRDALVDETEALRRLTIAEVGAPRFLTSGAHLEAPVADLGWFAELAEHYERWDEDLGEASPMGVRSRRRVLRRGAGVVG